MKIVAIAKVYSSIVSKDTCKDSVTGDMEAAKVNMPCHIKHLLNNR